MSVTVFPRTSIPRSPCWSVREAALGVPPMLPAQGWTAARGMVQAGLSDDQEEARANGFAYLWLGRWSQRLFSESGLQNTVRIGLGKQEENGDRTQSKAGAPWGRQSQTRRETCREEPSRGPPLIPWPSLADFCSSIPHYRCHIQQTWPWDIKEPYFFN